MMLVFKLIGDQGQILFIRYLNEIEGFRDKFETLFTTHDNLAKIYACENHVSNVSMTEANVPSREYCNSSPHGMTYFDKRRRIIQEAESNRQDTPIPLPNFDVAIEQPQPPTIPLNHRQTVPSTSRITRRTRRSRTRSRPTTRSSS